MLDMDFGQLQYMIDSAEILETISKWKKKSDNKELQKISEKQLVLQWLMLRITFNMI